MFAGEQQKHKDLLQKQRDELQEALDHQREEDERQLREQIDQQNLLNQQALEQQKQLIELQQQWQQDQQNLLTNPTLVTLPVGISSVVPVAPIAPVAPVAPIPVNNDQDSDKTTITDDSVVVENTSLSKNRNTDQEQPEEPATDDFQPRSDERIDDEDTKSEPNNN